MIPKKVGATMYLEKNSTYLARIDDLGNRSFCSQVFCPTSVVQRRLKGDVSKVEHFGVQVGCPLRFMRRMGRKAAGFTPGFKWPGKKAS